MTSKVKYDSVKVGDSLPTVTIDNVSRPDFVRYAGASGDFVPLHYDQAFVEAAGIPTVFAQGMWTAGCLSRCLTDYAGAGNVRRLKVRFARQVWPGDTLTCRGKVTGKSAKDGENLLEGELEVVNQKGEATVRGNFAVIAA
jgi:acyl dehydratase